MTRYMLLSLLMAASAAGQFIPTIPPRDKDTGGDHILTFESGENLSANTALTFVLGDAARTLTLSGDTTLVGGTVAPFGTRILTAGTGGQYATIALAVTAANAAASSTTPQLVLVLPGVYDEIGLICSQYVSIAGLNPLSTKISPGTPSSTNVIHLRGHNSCRGLYIQNLSSSTGQGLVLFGYDTEVEGCIFDGGIDHISIGQSTTSGNLGVNGGSTRIAHNRFLNTYYDSIRTQSATIDETAEIIIEHNYFEGTLGSTPTNAAGVIGNQAGATPVLRVHHNTAKIIGTEDSVPIYWIEMRNTPTAGEVATTVYSSHNDVSISTPGASAVAAGFRIQGATSANAAVIYSEHDHFRLSAPSGTVYGSRGTSTGTTVGSITINGSTGLGTNWDTCGAAGQTALIYSPASTPARLTTTTADTLSLTASDSSKTIYCTKTTTTQVITLPPTAEGITYTFVCGHADGEINISPNASDKITGKGIAASDDEDIKNTTASNAVGDAITLVGDGADGWVITSMLGTWAEVTP